MEPLGYAYESLGLILEPSPAPPMGIRLGVNAPLYLIRRGPWPSSTTAGDIVLLLRAPWSVAILRRILSTRTRLLYLRTGLVILGAVAWSVSVYPRHL